MAPRASGQGASRQVFRHCGPQHTDLDQTLAHAELVGGRYNPPAEFGAIYASASQADALQELHRRAERLGLQPGDLLPRVLLTLELRVEKLLDLTDEGVREAWGVQLEDLLHDTDYSRCHEIARSARRAGYEAIRFPAFDSRGVNYAIFLDRLKPGSSLRSISEESLDRAGQDRRSPGGG